ncbi:hypothetical protein [Nocardiopsis sp. CA-288880]|uniref:hypothetical protein n=1 Tax=Nocardiopsis sp. CA-288880 TaxID=3239995 RepID=UPI003D95305B
MPIIEPPQVVTVDTDELHTVVTVIRAAHHFEGTPFRREIIAAAGRLKEALLIPRTYGQPVAQVPAEPLWWVVRAADELGNDRDLPPVGTLFTAVDRLQGALDHQAARTDRGMTTVLEFECLVEAAALAGDDQ